MGKKERRKIQEEHLVLIHDIIECILKESHNLGFVLDKKKILLIGDSCIDYFVEGKVARYLQKHQYLFLVMLVNQFM